MLTDHVPPTQPPIYRPISYILELQFIGEYYSIINFHNKRNFFSKIGRDLKLHYEKTM